MFMFMFMVNIVLAGEIGTRRAQEVEALGVGGIMAAGFLSAQEVARVLWPELEERVVIDGESEVLFQLADGSIGALHEVSIQHQLAILAYKMIVTAKVRVR
jgi:hypothetical protein